MYVTKDTYGDAHWGLIPRTASETTFAPSNAMAETIATKYPFKIPFKEGQTCLIPASHLYEWKWLDQKGRKKQPYLIGVKDEPFIAFAGLWERNTKLGITSCTIITTPPNSFIEPIHDKMPVILPRESWHDWLNNADPKVLLPFDPAKMTAYTIGSAVGNVKNKGPEIMEPVAPREQPEIQVQGNLF